MDKPQLISRIVGFHRHIPSLQAYAALAGQALLDPDLQTDPDSRHTCDLARSRFSQKCLIWLDDFYGNVMDGERFRTADAAWMNRTEASFVPDFSLSHDDRHISLFLHTLQHVDWSRLPSELLRTTLDCIQECTRNVHNSLYASRRQLYEVLPRLYRRVQQFSDDLVGDVTEAILHAPAPVSLRLILKQLDRSYDVHLQTMRTRFRTATEQVSFAVRTGDLEWMTTTADTDVVLRSWSSLIEDTIFTSDHPMFDFLWGMKPRVPAAVFHRPRVLFECMISALRVDNMRSMQYLSRAILDHEYDCSTWPPTVWSHAFSIEAADYLIRIGCPVDHAALWCSDVRVAQYLMSQGSSIIPSSNVEAAIALRYVGGIRYMALDAWSEADISMMPFLCAAIRSCTDHGMLRELVGIVCERFPDHTLIRDFILRDSVNKAFLDDRIWADIAFLKTCLRLGADINAVHILTGRTALVNAARRRLLPAVRFLISAGACTVITDKHDKSALDYMDEADLQLHPLYAELRSAMQAELASGRQPRA